MEDNMRMLKNIEEIMKSWELGAKTEEAATVLPKDNAGETAAIKEKAATTEKAATVLAGAATEERFEEEEVTREEII